MSGNLNTGTLILTILIFSLLKAEPLKEQVYLDKIAEIPKDFEYELNAGYINVGIDKYTPFYYIMAQS